MPYRYLVHSSVTEMALEILSLFQCVCKGASHCAFLTVKSPPLFCPLKESTNLWTHLLLFVSLLFIFFQAPFLPIQYKQTVTILYSLLQFGSSLFCYRCRCFCIFPAHMCQASHMFYGYFPPYPEYPSFCNIPLTLERNPFEISPDLLDEY